MLLAIAVTAWFIQFGSAEVPLWIPVLGVLALLGIGLGFGGMVFLFVVAALKSLAEERKAKQVAPESRS
jgi:hypothetical protein